MKMAINATSPSQLENTTDDPDKDEFYYSIKKKIYQSAKEGFAINLCVSLNKIDDIESRNVLVNQVSGPRMEIFLHHQRSGKKTRNFHFRRRFSQKFVFSER